jgi:DMSO/TMAO reductase YedYZ molybdopterin-dependent catalytic subunit
VYALGGLPLRADLGGPLRLVAPGLGSCANVKAVSSISIAAAATQARQPCARARQEQPVSAPRRW